MPEAAPRRRVSTARYMLPAFAYFFTVGSVGFWIPLYLKSLGWSYSLVTWAATAYFAAITPSTIVSGALADITGRPNLLVCTGLTLNALAVEGVVAFHESPPIVLAMRLVQGAGLSVALPIALGSLSLSHGIRGGVSLTAIASAVGMASGSLAGGALASGPGLEWVFHSSALVSLAAALLACIGPYPETPRRPRGFLEAVSLVPPDVWVVAAALMARNAFASGVFSIMPVLFHAVLGASLPVTALAMAANPVFQVLTIPAASRVTRGRELPLYALGLAGTSLVFHLYMTLRSSTGLIAAQALLGVDYAFVVVAGNNYILLRAPGEIRYTASSIYTLAFNAGWVLGTLVAGPFMDARGPEAWVLLARLGCLASGALALAASPVARWKQGWKPRVEPAEYPKG